MYTNLSTEVWIRNMDTGICTGRESNNGMQETSADNNWVLTTRIISNVINYEAQSIIERWTGETDNLLHGRGRTGNG